MKKIRKWIRFFFGFSRTETNGFIILLPLLFAILFSEPLYRFLRPVPEISIRETSLLDSLETKAIHEKSSVRKKSVASFFSFDPNSASHEQFLKLGFSEKLATRIIRFRTKGGKFFVKNDLLKIYGMDSVHFLKLQTYISLPEKMQRQFPDRADSRPKVREIIVFNLNDVDTTRLKQINGIGSKLAGRILSYRKKLGGFVRLDQLKEVYGLDTAVIRRITAEAYVAENCVPEKININQSSDKELSSHPYISIVIAKAIVTYRFQHGNFTSVEEIRNLHIIKKEQADKIIPYVSIE